MWENFNSFPEVLLADSTYNVNDRNMPLYVLMVVDGNGFTQQVCFFVVQDETKETLKKMIEVFKDRNPA